MSIRIDGVVLLDKPAGMSSQGAVTAVKRAFNADKAGHTGTLDPMATGLLPICLGEATKYSQDLLDANKSYIARVKFGVRTDTGDAEGHVIEEKPLPVFVNEAELKKSREHLLLSIKLLREAAEAKKAAEVKASTSTTTSGTIN